MAERPIGEVYAWNEMDAGNWEAPRGKGKLDIYRNKMNAKSCWEIPPPTFRPPPLKYCLPSPICFGQEQTLTMWCWWLQMLTHKYLFSLWLSRAFGLTTHSKALFLGPWGFKPWAILVRRMVSTVKIPAWVVQVKRSPWLTRPVKHGCSTFVEAGVREEHGRTAAS